MVDLVDGHNSENETEKKLPDDKSNENEEREKLENVEPESNGVNMDGEPTPKDVFSGEVNTKIACLNCRDKKLKCDKRLPSCSRCQKKNKVCVYISHKKTGPKTHHEPNTSLKRPQESKQNINKENKMDTAKKQKKKQVSEESSVKPVNDQEKIPDNVFKDEENIRNNFSYMAGQSPLTEQQKLRPFAFNQSQNGFSNTQYSTSFGFPSYTTSPGMTMPFTPYPQQSQSELRLIYDGQSPSNANKQQISSKSSFINPLYSPSVSIAPLPGTNNHKTNTVPTPLNLPYEVPSPANIFNSSSLSISQLPTLLPPPTSGPSFSSLPPNNTQNSPLNLDQYGLHKLYKNLATPNTFSSNNTNDNSESSKETSKSSSFSGNESNSAKVSDLLMKTNNNNIPDFNTSLTDVSNKTFEDIIGLYKFGLTMDDVDKFHAFYFNSSTRIFKYSIQRYYNIFVKDPKHILHYSYMIWTISCFYLDNYDKYVDVLYQAALEQMNDYWESNRDSFHSDILTYLHAMCLKSQFEFLTGREMRAALTASASIRLTQMYGYDQIDLSPTTLSTPAIFFRNFSLNAEQLGSSTNMLLKDDNLDPDIPLVEERRRILWEVYAIDKWSSLVTGLPCALSVDSLSVIFTKLPSPTTFLPLNNNNNGDSANNEDEEDGEDHQNSYYLHEAMQKLDNNQVLLDINSSSSKILLLTISENIIKWCKMFLNMVELETLKNPSSIESIRHKVDELVRNFESMHNNLLFFDLTTEPLMNIVITNTTTLLYQSVLIKISSLFDLQLKEDKTGASISPIEKAFFKDILHEVSSISEKVIQRFIKKSHIENHLKKAPLYIVFINSIKSLFQCVAFIYRYNDLLNVDENEERKNSILKNITLVSSIINNMKVQNPLFEKTKTILNNGQELLDHSPQSLSFFDSFFDSAKTY